MTVRRLLAALACGGALSAGCTGKPAATAAPVAAEAARPEPPDREPAPARSAPPTCGQPAAAETAPAGKADAEALVRQLGDADFGRREAAQKALAAMGEKALPAVEKGAAGGDFEIAARCEQLIRGIPGAGEPEPPEIPEGLRAAFKQAWAGVWRGGHGPGAPGPQIRIQGEGIQMGPVTRTGGDSQTVGNSSGRLTVAVGSDGTITVTVQPTGKAAQTRTYRAESREDFERKYPRFAATYLR